MIKFLRRNYNNIYFLGLAATAVGLPTLKVLMSSGQLLLLANWLIDGRIKNKVNSFIHNKIALVVSSLFILHLIGLIYTTDFSYAYIYLRLKIPILILTIVISTSEPLSIKRFYNLLFIFIAAVVTSTLVSMCYYVTTDFVDIRNISIFISHIRLSLMVCLSIFILLYFIFSKNEYNNIIRLFFILIIIWFIYFLFILESVTGLSILIVVSFLLLAYKIFSIKNILLKASFLILLIAVPLSIFIYIRGIYKVFYFVNEHEKHAKLEKLSPLGNTYLNDTLNKETENGFYVWRNICEEDMKAAWNKRSHVDYNGKDRKKQLIRGTLMRYLTSKGYKKDADGVMKLSPDEIHLVEKGVADVRYTDDYLMRARIYETIWEYRHYQMSADPSASSAFQRIEFWKASLGIIKDNLLFGVGTGDMNIAFDRQYKKMKSSLEMKWRLRSHDQFLSIAVGFGLFGLSWFLFSLLFPFYYISVRKDYFYLIFFAIFFLSMITEDTIESQAGLTFFVFFNSLFLFVRKKENENIS